jgi:hypothetical protein
MVFVVLCFDERELARCVFSKAPLELMNSPT